MEQTDKAKLVSFLRKNKVPYKKMPDSLLFGGRRFYFDQGGYVVKIIDYVTMRVATETEEYVYD